MVQSYQLNRLPVNFFATEKGNEPVRKWLKELDHEDRKTIGEDIRTLQFGWPLGMPLVDSLGGGLWELRSRLSKGKIARIIFLLIKGI